MIRTKGGSPYRTAIQFAHTRAVRPLPLANGWTRIHSPWAQAHRRTIATTTGGDDATLRDGAALEAQRKHLEFALVEDGLRGLPWVEMGEACWQRAREVYRALGSRPGMMQRSVKHPDLLIAAAAERAGITLVHYDADYEAIAEITGQPVRWAAPRGSL